MSKIKSLLITEPANEKRVKEGESRERQKKRSPELVVANPRNRHSTWVKRGIEKTLSKLYNIKLVLERRNYESSEIQPKPKKPS